jgi:hypothetical protein
LGGGTLADCAEIVVECPFTVSVQGRENHLDPEDRTNLGPLLGLYPNTLSSLDVAADGTLQVTFETGAVLTVRPDPNYEAWEIAGPGDQLVVCGPGGATLSVWS